MKKVKIIIHKVGADAPSCVLDPEGVLYAVNSFGLHVCRPECDEASLVTLPAVNGRAWDWQNVSTHPNGWVVIAGRGSGQLRNGVVLYGSVINGSWVTKGIFLGVGITYAEEALGYKMSPSGDILNIHSRGYVYEMRGHELICVKRVIDDNYPAEENFGWDAENNEVICY